MQIEVIFLLLLVAFVFGLAISDGEKPSKLPPFTEGDAEQYWKDFDYWNKNKI